MEYNIDLTHHIGMDPIKEHDLFIKKELEMWVNNETKSISHIKVITKDKNNSTTISPSNTLFG